MAAEDRLKECKAAIQTAAVKMDQTADGILRVADVIEEVKVTSELNVKSPLVR